MDATETKTFTDAATETEPVPAVKSSKWGKLNHGRPAVKKTRGVRRPYRGLDAVKLESRLGVMQKRTDSLTEKLGRASSSLGKLRQEVEYRWEGATPPVESSVEDE